MDIGSIVGTHTGPGAVGLAYIKSKRGKRTNSAPSTPGGGAVALREEGSFHRGMAGRPPL